MSYLQYVEIIYCMSSITGVCSEEILFHTIPPQMNFGKNIFIHVEHGMSAKGFFKTQFIKYDWSFDLLKTFMTLTFSVLSFYKGGCAAICYIWEQKCKQFLNWLDSVQNLLNLLSEDIKAITMTLKMLFCMHIRHTRAECILKSLKTAQLQT